MMEISEEHIISTIVENKPGVLFRISNMFMRRGFNIESISVGPLEESEYSRMTITVIGDIKLAEQVSKQLNKLIDVIEVSQLIRNKSVTRELALIRINAENSKDRSDIMSYADVFRGRVVDVTPTNIMIEITGAPDKINAFIEIISDFKIEELARTGMTALPRG
jgi:acetolactate synthase-1/3 small subunit|tara:strand:+ start:1194 stop:1685 length:492 start_codon:yes stop_codon:yes gene_type:complete